MKSKKTIPKSKNLVQLAVIGAPHGVSGEVRVKTYTRDPMALGHYGMLYDETGRSFEIISIRPAKTVVIVRLKGVNNRNAAEKLNRIALFIDREQLPEKLEDNEFYHADLIGLEAIDRQGTVIGRITAIFDFGGGDLIELSIPRQTSYLIPFTKTAVLEIDLHMKHVVIDPVAAGLTVNDDSVEDDRCEHNLLGKRKYR